jgi:hypothetical protein
VRPTPRARRGFILITVLGAAAIAPPADAADLRIFSPIVEEGHVELENNSAVTFDRSAKRNDQQSHFGEMGYGVTDFWRTEIEGNWNNGDGSLGLRTLDNENIVSLLNDDAHRFHFGLVEEYDHAIVGHTPDTLTLGTLFQKESGASESILDVFLDRNFGPRAPTGTALRYAARSIWTVAPLFAPGLEVYGEPGRVGRLPAFDRQDHRVGPGLTGRLQVEGFGEIGYDVAYVFGLTPATPKETVVWRLELAFRF